MNAAALHPAQRALNLLRDLAYRATLYLPLLVMAVLALATYWLVSNAPVAPVLEPDAPLTHEPDYYMRGFALRNYNAQGALLSEMAGVELRHYPDTETLEVDEVRLESVRDGHVTRATAKRALTNADGSEVQLSGNAVVVRDSYTSAQGQLVPRLELRSEFLHAFLETERVQSHKPVVLVRGADQFSADSLSFDNLNRLVELKGRVKGVLSGGKTGLKP